MRTSIALILTSRRTLYFLYIRRHFEYFDKFNHHASWFCLKLKILLFTTKLVWFLGINLFNLLA